MSELDQESTSVSYRNRIPSNSDYRAFMQNEWADIHHSRNQEWTALGIVTGVHLGILQLLNFLQDVGSPVAFLILSLLGSTLGFIFAGIGSRLTLRHARLQRVKVSWIYKAEKQLGLVLGVDNPRGVIEENRALEKTPDWEGVMKPRQGSTGSFILWFYRLLMLLDVLSAVLFVTLYVV